MSKAAQELYLVLKRMTSADANAFPAIVKNINDDDTIDVELDGLVLPDVQCKSAVIDGQKGIKIKPAINSVVIVERIGDMKSDEYMVILYSEIDEHSIEVNTAKWLIDKEGFLLKKGNESLKKLVIDILDAIIDEKHNTPYGPTMSLTPNSVLKFEQLKTRVENLLKDA